MKSWRLHPTRSSKRRIDCINSLSARFLGSVAPLDGEREFGVLQRFETVYQALLGRFSDLVYQVLTFSAKDRRNPVVHARWQIQTLNEKIEAAKIQRLMVVVDQIYVTKDRWFES